MEFRCRSDDAVGWAMKTRLERLRRSFCRVGLVIAAWLGRDKFFHRLDQQLCSLARRLTRLWLRFLGLGARDARPAGYPEFVAAHAKGQYDSARYLQVLGAMQSNRACVIEGMQVVNWNGWSRWKCPAVFERGEATLVITLTLSSGQWLLSDFAVQI